MDQTERLLNFLLKISMLLSEFFNHILQLRRVVTDALQFIPNIPRDRKNLIRRLSLPKYKNQWFKALCAQQFVILLKQTQFQIRLLETQV